MYIYLIACDDMFLACMQFISQTHFRAQIVMIKCLLGITLKVIRRFLYEMIMVQKLIIN